MADRAAAQRLIERLHAARVTGDLAAMCSLFAERGRYEILGASADKPISIQATDLASFRPWLSMLVKVFRIQDYVLLSTTIEMPRVVAHWQANIYSKVTGITVATQLVDIAELGADRFANYTEFFAPR